MICDDDEEITAVNQRRNSVLLNEDSEWKCFAHVVDCRRTRHLCVSVRLSIVMTNLLLCDLLPYEYCA
jgi:hypothetical protein